MFNVVQFSQTGLFGKRRQGQDASEIYILYFFKFNKSSLFR
jgi:hypothetical protein